MSQDQPPWQYVILAVVGSSFFLGLFVVIPDDQPDMRAALLGLVVMAGQAAVARWIVGHVHGAKAELRDTLRRADRLIAELERRRDVSRETSRDVSRETRRRGHL